MSGWGTVPVHEVAEVFDGPHATPPKTDEGPWYLSISSLNGGRFDLSRSAHLSDTDFPRWTKRVAPRPGDTLFSYETRLGEAAYWKHNHPAALGRRMGLLRPKEAKVEPRYLTYAYLGPQFQELIRQKTLSGATVDRISVGEMPSWPLLLPSLATQREILEIIGSIDDLIENNRRRVEVLEDMARAIYREWFVKFRYPGHGDVPMVDSTLGPIPEGWQVGRVDSLILLQRGFDLPLKVRESGPIPVVGASGVQGSHLAAKATGPGVVTGRSGTIGVVNYVPGDFWPLNTSLWVREFRLATPRYAYFLLEGLDLKRAASGSAVPSLDRKVVHGLPVVCPPPNLIEGWDTRVAGMFEAVEALRSQSTRLSAIRDLLLPKLVTGQIDVSTLDLDALVSTGSTGESAVAP